MSAPCPPGSDDLKILIASTPKTGNTWVKHLLAALYQLPIVELAAEPEFDRWADFGRRWVGHQHYFPSPCLLDWLRAHRVTVVTTVRHPGDVFISLYHYVRTFDEVRPFDDALRRAMVATTAGSEPEPADERVAAYVRDRFVSHLCISVEWLRTDLSHCVRYEDLWRDPVAALRTLANGIQPVPDEAIERAIERCDIDLLRQAPGVDPRFFRKGSVGDWRTALPPAIVDLLRHHEPYPALFAALGYSLNPDDPLIAAPARSRVSHNPIRGVTHFDNGVPVPVTMVNLFLSVDSATSAGWRPVTATRGPATFYGWANGPAADDPEPGHPVLITELAAFVHRDRRDLQAAFPDPFGRQRVDYALWFVRRARAEWAFDDAFVRPLRARLLAWAANPAADDPDPDHPVRITELAAFVHRDRRDLQAAFPDPFGRQRVDYALWFVRQARAEWAFDDGFIQPMRACLLAWAAAPAADDRARVRLFSLTNLATHLYRTRPDVQARFPDPYGRQRLAYALWLWQHGVPESGLESAQAAPGWGAPAIIGRCFRSAARWRLIAIRRTSGSGCGR